MTEHEAKLGAIKIALDDYIEQLVMAYADKKKIDNTLFAGRILRDLEQVEREYENAR